MMFVVANIDELKQLSETIKQNKKVGVVEYTEISEEMFMYSNIKSVTLPSSIKSIGGYAFYGAPLEINYSGSENSWNKIDFGRHNNLTYLIMSQIIIIFKEFILFIVYLIINVTCFIITYILRFSSINI